MKEIHMTQGYKALVDDEDYDFLMQWKWRAVKRPHNSGHIYARRVVRKKINGKITEKTIWMHRFILNVPSGMLVDHANGNGLDNRRSNIRICNFAQNSRNRKRHSNKPGVYKGVYVAERATGIRYRSQIFFNGKSIEVGAFATEIEAARAYDAAARKYFGEFAWLNFPPEAPNGR